MFCYQNTVTLLCCQFWISSLIAWSMNKFLAVKSLVSSPWNGCITAKPFGGWRANGQIWRHFVSAVRILSLRECISQIYILLSWCFHLSITWMKVHFFFWWRVNFLHNFEIIHNFFRFVKGFVGNFHHLLGVISGITLLSKIFTTFWGFVGIYKTFSNFGDLLRVRHFWTVFRARSKTRNSRNSRTIRNHKFRGFCECFRVSIRLYPKTRKC